MEPQKRPEKEKKEMHQGQSSGSNQSILSEESYKPEQLRHEYIGPIPEGFRDRLMYSRSQVNVNKLTRSVKIKLRRPDTNEIQQFMQLARSFENTENSAITISMDLSTENEQGLQQITRNISQCMGLSYNQILFQPIDPEYLLSQFQFPINQRLQQNIREQIEILQSSLTNLRISLQNIINHFQNSPLNLSTERQFLSESQRQAAERVEQSNILRNFNQVLDEVEKIKHISISLQVIESQKRKKSNKKNSHRNS